MLVARKKRGYKVIKLITGSEGQWQLVLESEWSPNRDTVLPYGITVKTRFGTKPQVVHRTPLVCCQGRNDTQQNFEIPSIIGQCYNLKISLSALIDSGCLQTNIIDGRVAQLLLKDGNVSIECMRKVLD